MRKHLAHLAHDAFRGDHGHVAPQAIVFPLVDGEQPRLVRTAGANHLRQRRGVKVFFLETQHGLEPLALARVFKHLRLLQPQAVHRRLQILVLLAHVAQIEVVSPELAHAGLEEFRHPLRRRHQRIGPQADQPHPGAVCRVVDVCPDRCAAPARPADDLRHQQGRQHYEVSVAGEKDSITVIGVNVSGQCPAT